MKKELLAAWGLAALIVLRVSGVVTDGELLTIGDYIAETDTAPTSTITAGHIRVDVSAGGVKASGTLTLTENAADTNTVTIGNKVYTFQDTLTNVDGNVKIGATASDTIDNLIAAITLGSGAGTLYATAMTLHTQVTAAAGAGDTMTVTAKVNGTAANSYATTDTLAGTSAFGAATLANGAQPTAAEYTTALVAAWNAAQGVWHAERFSSSEVIFSTKVAGANPYAAVSETGTNMAVSAAAPYGGRGEPTALESVVAANRVPVALEVTLGNLHFLFPFTVGNVIAQVRVTSSGAAKAWTGNVTVSGGRVTLTNTGGTDFAATDTVTVFAAPA